RSSNRTQELAVDLGPSLLDERRMTVSLPVARRRLGQALEQSGDAGQPADEVGLTALEERTPLRRHRLGVVEVLVEKQTCVTGVDAVDVVHEPPVLYQHGGSCRATRKSGLGALPPPGRAGRLTRAVGSAPARPRALGPP